MTVTVVPGQVTQVSPLKVRVDGAATGSSADAFATFVPVLNARVQVAVLGRRLLVLDQGGAAVTKAQVDALGVTAAALKGVDGRTSVETPTAAGSLGATTAKAPRFHTGAELGLPGAYYAVVTISPWGDDSGGGVHQLAYGNGLNQGTDVLGGDIWHRYGVRTGNTWYGWRPLDVGDNKWTALGLGAGFTNYAPATYPPASFRKDGHGFVHLRGLIQGGAVGATIATLPVGYRPALSPLFAVLTSAGAARVDVLATGAIVYNGTAGAWLSLDGVTFYGEG